MIDIIPDVDRWKEQGQSIAVATVVETWGSAPRAAGAKMALTAAGEISGSVSGGCVEGAVVESGIEVLKSRRPALLHFGVADETAWEVGLACGGNIDVFVQPIDPSIYDRLRESIQREELVARLTVIKGPEVSIGEEMLLYPDGRTVGSLPGPITSSAIALGLERLVQESSRPIAGRLRLGEEVYPEAIEILLEIYPPPPSLIVVGGVHIAVALVSLANLLGYRTVVIDPRKAFGSENRFSHATRLYQSWPSEAFEEISINAATAVTMLTHDPKIDDPALHFALRSDAFYIGALGSERTQEKRRKRLREAGFEEDQIKKIYGPIGLNLGGRSPEEIALAIMGQIVAARNHTLDSTG